MTTPESLLPHPLFILNRAHSIFENHSNLHHFFKLNCPGMLFLHELQEQLINVDPLHIYIFLS